MFLGHKPSKRTVKLDRTHRPGLLVTACVAIERE